MLPINVRWILLLLGAALSLGAPVSTIWKHHAVMTRGVPVKFSLAPIDPYDPFRGRYVWLNFDLNAAPWADGEAPEEQTLAAYLSFERDENGFPSQATLHTQEPESGLYLQVDAAFRNHSGEWRFTLPFDRYYLNEADAPQAERIARDDVGRRFQDGRLPERNPEDSYLVVRVLDGATAVEALYVGGKTIEQRLAEAAE